MHDTTAGLTLRDVSVAFGTRVGLRSVSLAIAPGERVALLGPSGVGKTSLLRAIAGLDPLAGGSIAVSGRDVSAVAPERRGIVYLHQSPALFPHLSVLDNVGFPLEVRGIRRAEARERARAFLDRVQLGALASRSPTGLSGGQRHRVALARALAAEPEVLLLDEPFAALDPALRSEVRDAVFASLEVSGREPGAGAPHAGAVAGPAVMLVTHDVDEAASIAGRIAVLMDGAIVQDDAPTRLLACPCSVAVARFLGLPNIIEGERGANGVFRSVLGDVASVGPSARGWLVSRADAITAYRQTEASDPIDVRAATITESVRGQVDVSGEVVAVHERVSGATVHVRVQGTDVFAVPARGVLLAPGDRVRLCLDETRISVVAEPSARV